MFPPEELYLVNLEFNGSAKVVFAVRSTTTDLADELSIFHTSSHLIYTVMLCKLTHVLFVISHKGLSTQRVSEIS